MSKVIDMTGEKFGRLTVIKRSYDKEREAKQHTTFWECQCVCGNHIVVSRTHLMDGHIQSCGCLHDERAGVSTRTHGRTKERIHTIWTNMKQRCTNPKNEKYKRYGARGIKMCDEWLNSFEAFYDWSIQNGYNPNLPASECTIDRINNNGDYEPSNCRWTTNEVQMNNTSTNVYVEWNGEKKTATEWDIVMGFRKGTVAERLRKGWTVEDSICKPVRKTTRKVICEGAIFDMIKDCSAFYGVPSQTMGYWLRHPDKMPKLWQERKLSYL